MWKYEKGHRFYANSVNGIPQDYSIDFVVCEELSGKLGHLNDLSDSLWNTVVGFGDSYGDRVNRWQVSGNSYMSYSKQVSIPVAAGEVLGVAGKGGAFDFWLKDTRVQLSFTNTKWTHEFQHTVCPIDYFTEGIRNQLVTKLTNWSGEPVSPLGYCGKIEFDVTATAQGLWTRADAGESAEEYGVVLVYHNTDASLGAISVGVTGHPSWDSRVYTFTPTHTGLTNRAFDEVTADGMVYRYLCEEHRVGDGYSRMVLIQLERERSLRLQFIDIGVSQIPDAPGPYWQQSLSLHYIR